MRQHSSDNPTPVTQSSAQPWPEQVDVVILGAGLAGQSLARHLLLHSGKTVMMLEKRASIPPKRQKYGESSVQVSGYYYSRVLDMEEYLFLEHLIKYNLRFYWKTQGAANDSIEHYSQSYIRQLSNIPSYQLNRNAFESELLRRNLEEEGRFTFVLEANTRDVLLSDDGGDHRVVFEVGGVAHEVQARWLVDASGRGQVMAKKRGLRRESPIQHASFFWWVEGLVDVDKLGVASNADWRRHPRRRKTGHLPSWLATNHFVEEGLWFWVIPLQRKTSLGLVFDRSVLDHHEVFTVEKATKWVNEHFPLFKDDLAQRKVLDFSGLQSYAHDCVQTIYPERWGLVGEAGRFHDPLYSPGSDLISVHNTLLVDAILTDDPAELAQKCQLYESLMKAVYHAYVPTYANTYDCLGDQEAFILKYAWELSIYFGFYVFPFINDFFTDRRFVLSYLRQFSRLGPINRSVQRVLSAFFQWKKARGLAAAERQPHYVDFTEIATLQKAEKTFYQVGVSVDEAKKVLNDQLDNLEELARFTMAHVAAVVLDEPRVVESQAFVDTIDLDAVNFDPEAWQEAWAKVQGDHGTLAWNLDPCVLDRFRPEGDPRWAASAQRLRAAMRICPCGMVGCGPFAHERGMDEPHLPARTPLATALAGLGEALE